MIAIQVSEAVAMELELLANAEGSTIDELLEAFIMQRHSQLTNYDSDKSLADKILPVPDFRNTPEYLEMIEEIRSGKNGEAVVATIGALDTVSSAPERSFKDIFTEHLKKKYSYSD